MDDTAQRAPAPFNRPVTVTIIASPDDPDRMHGEVRHGDRLVCEADGPDATAVLDALMACYRPDKGGATE